jgi:hypothetical protein
MFGAQCLEDAAELATHLRGTYEDHDRQTLDWTARGDERRAGFFLPQPTLA